MYIWIGCKLPEAFEEEIRTFCEARNQEIGLNTVAFSLPQHISLKISFETAHSEQVLEDLAFFLSAQKPFSVQIQNAADAGNVLWMPVADNVQLERLHKELDERLESRFGVAQHRFDKTFLFHSTLFLDEDTGKLAKMKEALGNYPVERELMVDTFLLGVSETGKAGSYRVVRQIKI